MAEVNAVPTGLHWNTYPKSFARGGLSYLTMVAVLVLEPYFMNIWCLINELSIFLAYLCYVLVEVEPAEYSGFAITFLL